MRTHFYCSHSSLTYLLHVVYCCHPKRLKLLEQWTTLHYPSPLPSLGNRDASWSSATLAELCDCGILLAKLCPLRVSENRLRISVNTHAGRLTGNLCAFFGDQVTLLPLLRTWDVQAINTEIPYLAPRRSVTILHAPFQSHSACQQAADQAHVDVTHQA